MAKISRVSKLDLKKTLFLLCDIQEKFRPAMKYFEPMVKNCVKLVQAGKILEVPIIATEQYPEGLGHLVKDFDLCHASGVFPKTKFSMCIPQVEKKIQEIFCGDLKHIVLFGIEAHVCIEQTAIDLLERNYNVHVVADCCMSRILQDRDLALERLAQMGCYVTTSESVIFSLLKDKDHPKFKLVRKLFTEPSADLALSKSTHKL